jgi:hypothetical protein
MKYLSLEQETNPISGNRARPRTASVWPVNVCILLCWFHSLIVLSAEPIWIRVNAVRELELNTWIGEGPNP